MYILGIETSCDETAASIVKDGYNIISSVVASQAKEFSSYGGVIPEIAARNHLELLTPVIDSAFKEANLEFKDIEAVAYTNTPGLQPALLVGISHAKALAYSLEVTSIPVNHLDAHIYANALTEEVLTYPHIGLLVSGGHTHILFIKTETQYEILGTTRDDAAGEAFDKVARLLGLEYPGGPVIDKLSKDGDGQAYKFPRPMIETNDFDFSFSGLKTAVLYTLKNTKKINTNLSKKVINELQKNQVADLAASFQEAVTDVLVHKTIKAAIKYNVDLITLAGGVAANSRLREKMIRAGNDIGINVKFPDIKLCLDNAAMVAGLGYWKIKELHNHD